MKTELWTPGTHLDAPIRWRERRLARIDCDIFQPGECSTSFIDNVFGVMWACLYGRSGADGHIFQVLTKYPGRMREYFNTDRRESWARSAIHYGGGIIDPDGLFEQTMGFEGPHPRIWLGVSVEGQATADARIPLLLDTPAAVRFVSCDPLLGPVDLKLLQYEDSRDIDEMGRIIANTRRRLIKQVIVGGESGHGARPMHPNWARRLRDQCLSSDVAFLFKHWGEWAPRSGLLTGGGTDFVALDPECKRWPHVTRLGEHGLDTRTCEHCTPDAGEDIYMQRVGKQEAGRSLDGLLHDGYPEATYGL